MNCRQGDIAMVVSVGSYRGANRSIAQALLGIPVRLAAGYLFEEQPAWRLESNVHLEVNGRHVEVQGIVDAILRPIRGGDGDDEIIALAGKPQGVPA